ncbi:MAG: sel1 repeat family protein [Muribaculaceae bacterium]|nr:sel1 repeat family protein [Muribaculaceae bacterium]
MKKILLIFAFLALAFSFNANAQSIQELRDSMAMGNLNSQVDLACHYIEGDSVEQNMDEAFRLIKDAANKGNRYGELWLGICYHDGVGVAEDHQEAVKWFKSSAQKGNVTAMSLLAVSYEDGDGVEVDSLQAFNLYKQAADKGFFPAQLKVAASYEEGGVINRDLNQAFRYFKMAAENEDTEEPANYYLARYYFNGWGTDVDRDKARSLLESISDGRAATEIRQILNTIEEGDTLRMYEFQFRTIPAMLWDYEKGKLEKSTLIDVMEWQIFFGSQFITHYEWDWKDISSNVHQLNDSIEIIVYRFPDPSRMPLCLYSAAVINSKTKECFYYTLEKTMNFGDITNLEKCWVFGGMTRDNASHVSYDGLTGDVTEQQFIDFIRAFLSKSKKPTPMGETKYPTEE